MSVLNGTINVNNFLRNEVEWMHTEALQKNTAKQNTSYFVTFHCCQVQDPVAGSLAGQSAGEDE